MTDAVAIDLPLEPESARRAREQLKTFRTAVDETTFVDLCLLVNELVVEALHGSEDASHGSEDAVAPYHVRLQADLDRDRIRVVMAEGSGAYHLPSRRPSPGDPGFGLHLVQRLSDRWGIRREPDRAIVWLELLGGSRRET